MARIIPLLLVCMVAQAADAEVHRRNPNQAREAISRLQNQDVDQVVAAVRDLGEQGSTQAVGPLIELLQLGTPDAITHAVLEALGAISSPRSIDILSEFALHRRAEVRVLALQSLSTLTSNQNKSRVEAVLRDALRDSNQEVRITAAQSLGEGGFRNSMPILFQSFERGVSEACIAIGKLGNRAAAERLVGYLGSGDLSTLLEGLGEFLRRSNFNVDGKRMIVERLLELAGPRVREFFVAALAELPETSNNQRLRADLEAAIAQIPEE